MLKAVLNIEELHQIIDASKRRTRYRNFFAELIDREGRLIYRQGRPEDLGTSLAGEAAVRELMAGREGFVIEQPAAEAEDLERIHSAGRHLLDLINDILDLSKIEADSIELSPERFDLMTVV